MRAAQLVFVVVRLSHSGSNRRLDMISTHIYIGVPVVIYSISLSLILCLNYLNCVLKKF